MARIEAPVKTYTGTSAGVDFKDGIGETDDKNRIAWFESKGYTITQETPQEAAQEPQEALEPAAAETEASPEPEAAQEPQEALEPAAAETEASPEPEAAKAAKGSTKGGK